MKKLEVPLSGGRGYEILIGRGLLDEAGSRMKAVYHGKNIAVIADSNVAPLYAARVEESLRSAGFAVKTVIFPAGEKSKNLATLEMLYDGLLAPAPFALTRSDLIVTLGGGVTGDMGGFAAGTLLRGIPFVQIPTTLLAQVDASVGGKVAVDLKQGKNLAGLFYQPRLVLMDPDTLDTLPERVFLDGMGEVVKHGVIRLPALFSMLEECPSREALRPLMEELLYQNCDCKRQVVIEDEKEAGGRMVLNFGHTLGHAYEKLGGYQTYMHGEAVCCGMAAILHIGERQGITPRGTAARLERLLAAFGLPYKAEAVSKEALLETLSYDKKGSGSDITVVFSTGIGSTLLKKMPKAQFADWVREFCRQEGEA